MGQVWQATDTQLNRKVALKILPDAFAADPDRLARFKREAQILASLNHPNIAAIYGIEESDDTRALVLELVEGPTLADRIAKGPIPLDEALPIAKQIAEALEAAHEAGVIHRDLKPPNIKVREDGTVKVLDFGLAKALDPNPESDPSQSPTLTAAATQMGVIMGTASYMSPEQARGKSVDKRSDIWAFGCVLYEMLTGRPVIQGELVSDVLAKIIEGRPDLAALPAGVPPPVRQLLRRCLEKDPRRRLRDIGEALIQLEDAIGVAPDTATATTVASRPVSWRWLTITALGALGLGSLITGTVVWSLRPTVSRQPAQMVLLTPPEGPLRRGSGQPDVAISRDGSRVVYRSGSGVRIGGQLYLREMGGLEATLIPGAEGAQSPFFSPDGEWVGYFHAQEGTLKKVSVLGGTPLTITDLNGDLQGASWGRDDAIVFATTESKGLLRISADGGDPELLTTIDLERSETDHFWPAVVPDGRAVLFTAWSGSAEASRIRVASLETGEVTDIAPGGSYPRYASSGHVVYAVGGTLRAVGFDVDRLEVTRNPVPVLENVDTKSTGAASYDVSESGSIAYVAAGSGAVDRNLMWVDQQGLSTLLVEAPADYAFPRLSPDGTQVAVSIGGDNGDIWLCSVERRACSRLTVEGGNYPVWTPDGTRVTFNSDRAGDLDLYWKPADGSGEAEPLLVRERNQYPISWSPDGRVLAFSEISAIGSGLDNMLLPLGGEPEQFVATLFDERSPTFSPNGRWIAYRSNESGTMQLYVRPYPGPGGRYPVSLEGGEEPIWSRDGRQLYFREGDRLMVTDVGSGSEFSVGEPRFALVEGYDVQTTGTQNYDIDLDGQRFVMIRAVGDESGLPAIPIYVTLNWDRELLERVAVP